MPFIILFLYLVIIYVFLFSFYDNNTFDNLELLKEKRKKTKKNPQSLYTVISSSSGFEEL